MLWSKKVSRRKGEVVLVQETISESTAHLTTGFDPFKHDVRHGMACSLLHSGNLNDAGK